MELIDRDAINEKCRNTKVDAVFPDWMELPTVAKQSVIKLARWYKTTLNTAPAVYIAPEQFGLWIPVTERLPRQGHRILGFTGTSTQIAAHMGGDRWWTDYHDRTITAGKLFTHWMPLPEPPKEV